MTAWTKRQEPVLYALAAITKPDGEWCVSFETIDAYLDNGDIAEIRRLVRALKRRGLVELHRVFDDDGFIGGSGHCITRHALRLIGEAELKQAIAGNPHLNQD